MERPSKETVETIPATYKTITKPITHGISINPMKNVTDPQSIKVKEIPSINIANPAGDIEFVVDDDARGRRVRVGVGD